VTGSFPQASFVHIRCWLPVLLAGLLAGCSTVGYYYQSARGHLDLMHRARDIDRVLNDESVSSNVRTRLAWVREVRQFASEQLHLPDNDSYRAYADLERDYAIWNVFAAPELSVEPHKWCFPIVGCVVYRGYFKEEDAHRYARSLREQGLETYVAGVPAYSTIGWFDDPVVSTILHYPEAPLAGLIFHELAHQVAYAKGDSVFNESFATAVEIEGVERWLRHQGRYDDIEAYRLQRQRDARVVELILAHRNRLDEVYSSQRDRNWKLERKEAVIADLRREYRKLIEEWDGYRGWDRWFGQELNNAHFVVVAAYHEKVPAFQALLAQHGGDLESFYDAVAALSRRPEEYRDEYLESIQSGMPARRLNQPTSVEDAS
jgi:predicted aminopeptidase